MPNDEPRPTLWPFSRISRRLILYILLFSSLITLILTAMQLYREYSGEVEHIHKRLKQVEITQLGSITRAVWTVDIQSVRLQMEGLLKLPDIVAIELEWLDPRPPLRVGSMPAHPDIERSFELSHLYRGQEIALGRIRFVASLDMAYQRLLDSALVILVSQAIKTFLVSLFILFLFDLLVTRHLVRIANFTRRKDLLDSDSQLRLERRKGSLHRGDELDQVATAINSLAANIRQALRQLQQKQAEQEHLVNTDTLTGLPNRHRFLHVLEERLRDQTPCSVMLGDLNGFKDVNDSLGHQAGDLLLKALRPRMEMALGPKDLVARLGGDEFAFLVEGGSTHASNMAHRIESVVGQPFEILDVQLSVGMSIGVARYPEHTDTATDLLRYADMAMYTAKGRKEPWRFYNPGEHIQGARRLQLISDLRNAIEQDQEQLQLHYQPQIDIASGRCTGSEALLRWEHPEFGPIPPCEFIPFAEKSDLMSALTLWVIKRAIRDHASGSPHAGSDGLQVSLNISSRNLQDQSFAGRISEILAKGGVAASGFMLEITESAIMQDPRLARSTIQSLAEMGFGIAIDDFGTGYSSLAYLKHLPVDEIKIDRTFVADMLSDSNDAIIVKSTIELSHNLGLRVIAEGVENAETAAELARLGCDLLQGFHYARPMPIAELRAWHQHFQGNDEINTGSTDPGEPASDS